MAEGNPVIDRLSEGSPAKQDRHFFLKKKVMDAEDSIAVTAVTMTTDP